MPGGRRTRRRFGPSKPSRSSRSTSASGTRCRWPQPITATRPAAMAGCKVRPRLTPSLLAAAVMDREGTRHSSPSFAALPSLRSLLPSERPSHAAAPQGSSGHSAARLRARAQGLGESSPCYRSPGAAGRLHCIEMATGSNSCVAQPTGLRWLRGGPAVGGIPASRLHLPALCPDSPSTF